MKTGGNVRGEITKKPGDLDPASAHAAVEQAEEFGFRVRDLIDRGHRPRDAVVIALRNAGMYEILKKRPGAMERIVAWFETEVERLTEQLDRGRKVVRGVPIVPVGRKDRKADADPVLYAADGVTLLTKTGT